MCRIIFNHLHEKGNDLLGPNRHLIIFSHDKGNYHLCPYRRNEHHVNKFNHLYLESNMIICTQTNMIIYTQHK